MTWFLAQLVIEICIADEPRNVVHINSHLVRAKSSTEAEKKANKIGKECATSYKNTDGKKVKFTFRGIRDLYELIDGVSDGAEIIWEEHFGIKEDKIQYWLDRTKRKTRIKKNSPNYMPEKIMKELEAAGFNREELMNNRF